MSKPSDRLISRLIREGEIEPGEYHIERTYAGYWQRKEGAFSWMLMRSEDRGYINIGSQFTVRECVDAERWEWYGEGIVPVKESNDDR